LARSARGRLEPERLRLFQLLWGAAGLLFVLYLVYCEIVLLHRLCEWCTVIHLLTLATFLVALSRWQQGQGQTPVLARQPAAPPREHATPVRTTTNARTTRTSTTVARSRRPVAMGTPSKARGKRR
jgi:Vitamin K epoxide reductase family